MNALMKIMKERRSIRNYEEKDVPDDALNTILEAVQWAPSWANTQCWEIVVIKDQAVKEKVQAAVPTSNPGFKSIAKAPVLLAVCGRKGTSGYYKDAVTTKFGDWFMFDLGMASQNICLAAHALGLGTLVVGLFDHDKAGAALNLPETAELVTLMPLGYPSKVPSAPKRKEIREFIHFNRFGNRG